MLLLYFQLFCVIERDSLMVKYSITPVKERFSKPIQNFQRKSCHIGAP